MSIQEQEPRKVTWTVFTWALSVLLLLIGISITYAANANGKADLTIQSTSDNRVKINEVDTRTAAQFSEILRSLERLEKANGINTK